jgi:hypothetical protein
MLKDIVTALIAAAIGAFSALIWKEYIHPAIIQGFFERTKLADEFRGVVDFGSGANGFCLERGCGLRLTYGACPNRYWGELEGLRHRNPGERREGGQMAWVRGATPGADCDEKLFRKPGGLHDGSDLAPGEGGIESIGVPPAQRLVAALRPFGAGTPSVAARRALACLLTDSEIRRS